MRWLSTVVVLVLAMPAYAAENEAEKLFRQMEKKITGAKTIKVRCESTMNFSGMKITTKTNVVFGEGNKAFYEIEFIPADGKASKGVIISNGNKVFFDKGGFRQTHDTPKTLGPYYRAGLARVGSWGTDLSGATKGKELPNLDDMLKVSDFKLGAKEKVGNAETRVVEYTIVRRSNKDKTDKGTAKVWINTQTHLPAKLQLRGEGGGAVVMEVTDTFGEFIIDGNVDAKLFELPQ